MKDRIPVKTYHEHVPYQDALSFFAQESRHSIALLFDSRRTDLTYGSKSVVVTKPVVQFTGRGSNFSIRALSESGGNVIATLEGHLKKEEFNPQIGNLSFYYDRIEGAIERRYQSVSEDLRLRQPSLATVLRSLLRAFHNINSDDDLGFYGAVAYDFVRQFEDIGSRFGNENGQDISLFLPGELVVFDKIRQTATRKQYSFNPNPTEATTVYSPVQFTGFPRQKFDMSEAEVLHAVEEIIRQIKEGEMIQAVLSRTEYVPMQRHPLESYAALCERNPSPYCFYMNLGDGNALFGSSPELHVQVKRNGLIEIKPLAGTRRRAGNAIDDYAIKSGLLNDEKERREHVMLVDLARNDIGRVCSNVEVMRFMDVVEFPNIFHIGSVITGKMREGYDGIDAVAATLPAGTLSGAPKVRAMQAIEQLEGSKRGYYGGCVGAFYLDGSCATAITIRSVYCNNGIAHLRAGAGIVALSEPQKELEEILLKHKTRGR